MLNISQVDNQSRREFVDLPNDKPVFSVCRLIGWIAMVAFIFFMPNMCI
jgi:hypothetical protein